MICNVIIFLIIMLVPRRPKLILNFMFKIGHFEKSFSITFYDMYVIKNCIRSPKSKDNMLVLWFCTINYNDWSPENHSNPKI